MSELYRGECSDRSVFELGDTVSFDHYGDRLAGRVVRVYASRLNYHVEVHGQRYEVSVPDDNPERA